MKFNLIRLLIAILLTVSLINFSRVLECDATGKGEVLYLLHEVRIYSKPGFKGKFIQSLDIGTILMVLVKDGDWFKVQFDNDKTGWVFKKWATDDKSKIAELKAEREADINNKIEELEAQVKPLPVSDVYGNLRIYKELLSLDPTNKVYQKKEAYYKSKKFDFRKTRWGMTREEVEASEKLATKTSGDQTSLNYKTKLLDKNMRLVYKFDRNKLVEAFYFSFSGSLELFNEFNEALTSKYGKNGLNVGQNELYWQTDTTVIICKLHFSNSTSSFFLVYRQKEYDPSIALEKNRKIEREKKERERKKRKKEINENL